MIVNKDNHSDEKHATSILKELFDEEEIRTKDNKRATFFVNLIYFMSLILFTYMFYIGITIFALPALALVSLGALAFNLFIYKESKRTKKRQKSISDFYLSYEYKKNN